MKVYVIYEDTDNSCSDPDCCGGPCPSPHIKIFSSKKKAAEYGYGADDLIEIVLDSNELKAVLW